MTKFLLKLINTDSNSFVEAGPSVLQRTAERASKLGYYFQGFHSFYELYSENVEYSPDVALFFNCLNGHLIKECFFNKSVHPVTNHWVEADVFNDFIQVMRARAKAEGTRKKMADWSLGL